jgi:hypothetical protein
MNVFRNGMPKWFVPSSLPPVRRQVMRVVGHHQPAFQALRCLNPDQRTRAYKTRQKTAKKAAFPLPSAYIRWQ